MTRFLRWLFSKDTFALLFTPVVTVILVWLICILAYGAWEADTQGQRIGFLGALAIVLAVLIGLGGLWLQGRGIDRVKVSGPAGSSVEIDTEG